MIHTSSVPHVLYFLLESTKISWYSPFITRLSATLFILQLSTTVSISRLPAFPIFNVFSILQCMLFGFSFHCPIISSKTPKVSYNPHLSSATLFLLEWTDTVISANFANLGRKIDSRYTSFRCFDFDWDRRMPFNEIWSNFLKKSKSTLLDRLLPSILNHSGKTTMLKEKSSMSMAIVIQ